MKNDGGSVFPQDLHGRRGDDPQYQGMTLRDWFAGQAISGLMAAQIHGFNEPPGQGRFSELAYELADAMIKERNK